MNEIVRQGDVIHSLADLQGVARTLALSGFFQDATGSGEVAVAKATAKILAGRELGFAPFASMNGIYLIQGRPSVSANLMAAAVKRSGRYDYKVRKMEDDECSIEFFERGGDKLVSLGISKFTKVDAGKANTKNMNTFPRNMLFARAMSNGVRWFCPDVFDGNAVYTPEELGADVDEEGNVVEGTFTVQGNGNGAPQQERPVWQTWDKVSEALDWAFNYLGEHSHDDSSRDDVKVEYNTLREQVKPTSKEQMYEAWYKHVNGWVRMLNEQDGLGDEPDGEPNFMHDGDGA